MLVIIFIFLLGPQIAMSSIIAVIDSGTDMEHQDIVASRWENPVDIRDNNIDEDNNGFLDDFFGWNFAENNNQVIDYKYLSYLDDDIKRFFEIQSKSFLGTITEEDRQWAKAKLSDQAFVKKLMAYANFMHGTHVSGITLKDNNVGKVLAVKLIPTEVSLPGITKNNKDFGVIILKMLLTSLANKQMESLQKVGEYIHGHKADIANGSFGTGYKQASQIVKSLFESVVKRPPTEAELKEVSIHFLSALVEGSKKFVGAAPKTLFVFAAGNDGTNNDEYPTSPANVEADNAISVAATFDTHSIAPFSNYGNKVDVAAPGVNILSAVPGNEYLKVSGTSQAAPYVANVASEIKDRNPNLTPAQIKAILIKTVDVRDYLRGKVASSGMVNKERAVLAAEQSKHYDLDEAIALSKEEIVDNKLIQKSFRSINPFSRELVLPLPSPFKM